MFHHNGACAHIGCVTFDKTHRRMNEATARARTTNGEKICFNKSIESVHLLRIQSISCTTRRRRRRVCIYSMLHTPHSAAHGVHTRRSFKVDIEKKAQIKTERRTEERAIETKSNAVNQSQSLSQPLPIEWCTAAKLFTGMLNDEREIAHQPR